MLRSLSVSSIRKTKVPPWWRANAQLKSAVRARPTCGLPVGLGAMRTRTVSGSLIAVATLFVRVPRPAIETSTSSPTSMGPTPSGVPVRMTSPGSSVITLETCAIRVGMSKIRSFVLTVLLEVAVEVGLHAARPSAKSAGRGRSRSTGPSGQNESKPLARVNCTSLLLQVARGHVVGDRVAVDDVGGLLGRDVAADPADHDGELALEVQVLRLRRVEDRVAGADHAGVRLEEHQRLGRARRCPSRRRARRSCGRCRPPCCAAAPARAGGRPPACAPRSSSLTPTYSGSPASATTTLSSVGLAELVELAGDHAVQRVLAGGESADAHPPSLSHLTL